MADTVNLIDPARNGWESISKYMLFQHGAPVLYVFSDGGWWFGKHFGDRFGGPFPTPEDAMAAGDDALRESVASSRSVDKKASGGHGRPNA